MGNKVAGSEGNACRRMGVGASRFSKRWRRKKPLRFDKLVIKLLNKFPPSYYCSLHKTGVEMRMFVSVRSLPLLILSLAALMPVLIPVHESRAQTSVTTNPVGYVQLSCSASSDTVVSVPFTQPTAYAGLVASISGSTVTVSGAPGWTANQFAVGSGTNTYYALLTSGTTVSPRDGATYTVAASSSNTLTLELNGDTISGVPSGSNISIIAYWTLNTVFPASNAGISFTASAGSTARTRATQILFPDTVDAGTNLPPGYVSETNTYYIFYFYNSAWRLAGGDSTVDVGNTPIPVNSYIIVRNAGSPSTLTAMGSVALNNTTMPLLTDSNQLQDNAVSLPRPVDVSLNNLGLITSNAFTPSTGSTARTRADQLLIPDNTIPGTNNPVPSPGTYTTYATGTFYYYNGAWRLAGGDSTVDCGNALIHAGTGFTIRKVQTSNGGTVLWENTPTYTNTQ